MLPPYLKTFQFFSALLVCAFAVYSFFDWNDISNKELQKIFDDDFKNAIILCTDSKNAILNNGSIPYAFTYLRKHKPEYGNYTVRDCSARFLTSSSLYEHLNIPPTLAKEQPVCILALRYSQATIASEAMLMNDDPTPLQEHIFSILIQFMFGTWA